MTPEQIDAIKIDDLVEVKPNVIREGWYSGRVTSITRECDVPSGPMFTDIKVWVEDEKRTFSFTGPQIVMQVRVPPSELDALRTEVRILRCTLDGASRDREAFKAAADERIVIIRSIKDELAHTVKARDAFRAASEKAEVMLDGARKALASYFGRTCEDIVPEVKHAVAQLAEARVELGVRDMQHANFIGGVLKALGYEGFVPPIDEVRLLHQIKQLREASEAKKPDVIALVRAFADEIIAKIGTPAGGS